MNRPEDCTRFEELLDGLVAGDRPPLSPEEQSFVDGHQARCERCALSAFLFEELGRAGEEPTPGEASLELRARRIVVEEEWQRRRTRSRRWRIAAALGPAAFVVTAVGATVALSLAGVLPWTIQRTEAVDPAGPQSVQPDPVQPDPVGPHPGKTGWDTPGNGNRAGGETAVKGGGLDTGDGGVDIANTRAVALVEPRSLPDGTEGGPPPSIEELLARARRARLDGDWDGSAAAYEALISTHRDTPEAATCLVSLGQLQLEQLDRPADALEAFRQYLALEERGPLAEEAAWGGAAALRQLGRDDEERAALESLLADHPTGMYSDEARTRLGELGDGT